MDAAYCGLDRMESTALHIFPPHLQERIRALNSRTVNPSGEFILYWMHHAVRSDENPALDVACLASAEYNLPLLVYQGLSGNHSFNSDRHHTFIMQGAKDVQKQFEAKNIRYVFYLGRNPGEKSPLYPLSRRAALVITEDFPAPPFPAWTHQLGSSIDNALWAVDTQCIVPMQSVRRQYDRAYKFRKDYEDEIKSRIVSPWSPQDCQVIYYDADLDFPTIDFSTEHIHNLCASCSIDHSVGPVHHTVGGSDAGYSRWNHFKTHGLRNYHKQRNDPTILFPRGVSRLSSYLHYGHVSPFRIAHETALHRSPGAEKFLDELIIWRELAHNLCFHKKDVESIHVLPSWARSSLLNRTSDQRPALYSKEQLERGETEDPLWNAAQHSLNIHGELHNNVRMTWGKAYFELDERSSRSA